MVLERLVGKSLLVKQPDVALFIGFTFTLIGFATSYLIFVNGMSVAMIGWSSIIILPYIIKIMKPEKSEYTSVFKKDSPSIRFFATLFLGMALAYTILFGIAKPGTIADGGLRDTAFATQLGIINENIAGDFAAGMFGLPNLFYQIISNNLVIIAIAVVLSYFYGSGAIFVLNYNASIAGIVYGSWINTLIWGGVPAFTAPLLFLPHTILEILGYLLAAIAGLTLSKPLTKKNNYLIKRDTAILITLAVALIIIGGYVEIVVPSWRF